MIKIYVTSSYGNALESVGGHLQKHVSKNGRHGTHGTARPTGRLARLQQPLHLRPDAPSTRQSRLGHPEFTDESCPTIALVGVTNELKPQII